MKLQEYIILALVIFAVVSIPRFIPDATLGGATGGSLADSCTASTTTAVPVGASNSLTVLTPYSNRAYVRIQQPTNATNTVTINLSSSAAVVGNGIQLTPATSTNSVPFVELGLNTANPYTGTINAITSAGSTTVLVSTCNYP